MKITVLGCGPAGLLAAHAAVQSGHPTKIISQKVKSKIGGAQYLHTHIPDLTKPDPDGVAHFEYRGAQEGYAQKVYGDPHATTSWGSFMGSVPIWNMRRAYDDLWMMYEGIITDTSLEADHLMDMHSSNDLVLSTIPRTALCWRPNDHQFSMQEVLVWYGKSNVPAADTRNQVIYSGHLETPWYRYSNLFGWESIEWPADSFNANQDLIRIKKPIATNCDCLPGVMKLGRYGRWEKKILSHDAYWDAITIIARAEQGVRHAQM